MGLDQHTELIEKLAAEARAGGLIVRCEAYGVLAIVHPKHGQKEEQPGLPLPVPPREKGGNGG